MLRRSLVSLSFATLAASITGCATDGNSTSAAGRGGGKADGSEATVVFADDWSETVSGALVAGSSVHIEYDLDRLQTCRGSSGGSEAWGITGYASFDGAAPVAFGVSRLAGGHVEPVAAELDIPDGTHTVALWFAINNRWGCIAYDSNENANYTFDVARSAQGATLSFEADWSIAQSGPLTAGSQATVHYDPARLAECAASSAGMAAWSVAMHYRVDGGHEQTLLVTRPDGADVVPSDPALTVPTGGELETWFSATSVYGCHAYDSDYGANYHFAIE